MLTACNLLPNRTRSNPITFPHPCPVHLKLLPASILGLVEHLQLMHDHIITALPGHLPLTHIPAHGNVQEHDKIRHGPRPTWDGRLHHGPAVDPPDHPTLVLVMLPPRELEPDGPALLHVVHGGGDDTVLIRVLRRIKPPVQTRVIHPVAVPRLGDVDLAVRRPREGLERQEPERRPDPQRAGQSQGRDQTASGARQALSRNEPRRRVFARWVGVVRLADGPQHEFVVRCVERVGRLRGVLLDFVVAPAVVVALFVLPGRAHGCRRVEARLPVDGRRTWTWRAWVRAVWDRRWLMLMLILILRLVLVLVLGCAGVSRLRLRVRLRLVLGLILGQHFLTSLLQVLQLALELVEGVFERHGEERYRNQYYLPRLPEQAVTLLSRNLDLELRKYSITEKS